MLKNIVILLLTAASSFAQTTWNNLKFGTSPAEVKASLSKQGLRLTKMEAVWEAEPHWDLVPSGRTLAFHFTPDLSFSNGSKLERIELTLRTDEHKAEGMNAVTLTSLAAGAIQEQLVGKYGVPASQTGICDKVSVHELIGGPGKVECKAIWKAVGQTVTLRWTYYEISLGVGQLIFSITYVSSASGGV